MAVWTTAYINNLPDGAFLYIAPGGKKDSGGKTVPRSLRYLPYKDDSGAVDMPHLNNAKARLSGTQIPASVKPGILAKIMKLQNQHSIEGSVDDGVVSLEIKDKGWLSSTAIKLDNGGNLPTRFPLLHTGNWENSVKGNFSVGVDDLKQIKQNFDDGIGFPTEDASTGLAIDLAHDYQHEAAAWIKGMELQVDPSDPEKATLFATPVDWTDVGAKAIQSGQYKCVSPMGFFGRKSGKLSMWSNPTNLKEKVANVIEGAGLTNIPFLRGMQPIRADRSENLTQDSENVIYVYDRKQKPKEQSMKLDELRILERDALTVPQLDFLAENKSELSKDELSKFKLDEDPENDPADNPEDKLSAEDKETLAAIKAGDKKLVDAKVEGVEKERLDRMESTIDKYRKQDVIDTLDKHVKRGAIKQDAAKLDGYWAKQLLAANSEDEEKSVKDALDGLPGNDQLAQEIGTAEDVAAGSTARDQLDAKAKAKVAAAAKDGKELLYADALKQTYREEPDLRTQDIQEQKQKVGA